MSAAPKLEAHSEPFVYYEDEWITLWCGSFEDVWPHYMLRPVRHSITDPPYEEEAHTSARRTNRGFRSRDIGSALAIGFDPITEAMRSELARANATVCRGWSLTFCQIEAVGAWKAAINREGGRYVRGMPWDKVNGTPQLSGDRPAQAVEGIALAWNGGGRMSWNGGGKRGKYRARVNSTALGRLRKLISALGFKEHPTMKPPALYLQLLEDFTDPGDTVADWCAGSGLLGIACREMGRKAVLVEMDPDYCELAAGLFSLDLDKAIGPGWRKP